MDELNAQFTSLLDPGHSHLPYSVRGWYRLLWDAGIPLDFVSTAELDEPYLAKYKALILPFPLSLSEDVAGKLARYVTNGGNLISEAAPGRTDEHGFCTRGELSPALARLFGVRHTALALVREPAGGMRWSPAERTWGEYFDPTMLTGDSPLKGQRLRANFSIETFECAGSTPLLRHGNAVAGVTRRVGAGCAWLLGTYVGHSGTAYRDPATHACVQALLAQCGVVPERFGELLVRRRVGRNREAWLLTNPTNRVIVEQVNMAGWQRVEDLLGEPMDRAGDVVTLTVESLDVRMLLLSK